ncbi:MAG: hypothetical protein JKY12_06780 [Sneathiella sp.]|nr:hypothetical protein [Sneathiella sp.]
MKRSLISAALAVFLMTGISANAMAEEKGADELAVEGLEKLINALSIFIDSIPQYEAPEILENGDIIMRRKKKEEETEKDTGIEKTST